MRQYNEACEDLERHEQLALQGGETVWIRPRSLRVFQGEQPLAAQHFELGAGI